MFTEFCHAKMSLGGTFCHKVEPKMVFECPENTDTLETKKGLYPGHNIAEYCEKCSQEQIE